MKLTKIESGESGGLVFHFDDKSIQREWAFEPASIAEFLSLLLDGGVRGERTLELPPATVRVASEADDAVRLHLSLPKVDMAVSLSDEQLLALRDAIDRRLGLRTDGQRGSQAGRRALQMVAGIAGPSGHRRR